MDKFAGTIVTEIFLQYSSNAMMRYSIFSFKNDFEMQCDKYFDDRCSNDYQNHSPYNKIFEFENKKEIEFVYLLKIVSNDISPKLFHCNMKQSSHYKLRIEKRQL